MKALKKSGTSHVQSVGRALLLVETLADLGREASITELSKLLQWPKSTVHGLISTLRDYHYIDQSQETGHYKLGVRFFEIGNIVARSWDVRTVALPHMQRMNEQLGEMVQLAVEDNAEVLYLDKIDSSHMIRIVSEVGGRMPMHCTGLGKALLAYKTPAEIRSIISQKGMPAMTQQTITSIPQLEKELAKIRQSGYAMDDREAMDSLRCVAAPIFEREGNAKYAVSVSGLYNNMQGKKLDMVIELVVQCATAISHALGFREK